MKNAISESRATIGNTAVSWLATSLSLAFVAVWILLGNLGCITFDLLSTFVIKFDPAFFQLAPGKSGQVQATLEWAETRALDAKTWSVDSARPKVLDSATTSPTADSGYTNISLQCGTDPTVFNPDALWTASANSVYQVGVHASFVDPVWKSISGGQEVVIGRRAYLPLRAGQAQMKVTMESINSNGPDTLFKIKVINALEGYKYTWSGYYKYTNGTQHGSGDATLEGGQATPTNDGVEGVLFINPEVTDRKYLVVFNLIQSDSLGRVIRTDVQSFRCTIKAW